MASYRRALQWIAQNDDCEFLKDESPVISVTASLVADMFGKTDETVMRDLDRACLKYRGKNWKG